GDMNLSAGSVYRIDGVEQSGSSKWTAGSGSNIYRVGDNISIGTSTAGTARLTIQSTSTNDILNLFETGGTEVFTVLENGNVGIGTTEPSSLLNLKGTLSTALTGTVAVTNASTTVVGTTTVFTTELAVGDSIKIGTETFTVSVITDNLSLTLDSAYAGTTASGLTGYKDPTLFAIDNGDAVNKLTVTKSGNVGIGTTTPSSVLQVQGTGTTSASSALNITNSVGTSLLYVGDNGRVGIGTTTPEGGLHIVGTAGGGDLLADRTDQGPTWYSRSLATGTDGKQVGQFLFWGKDTSDNLQEYARFGALQTGATADDGELYFKTGIAGVDTEKMRIDSAGNVGIGVTDPDQKLEVNGRIKMTTWTADGDTVAYRDTATDSIALQASDLRLKKNLEPLTDALDTISEIGTYKLNMLDEPDGAKKRLGVIAQDLLPILPELTFTFSKEDTDEVYYGVHYDKLTVLLLAGIQEQQLQIEELRTLLNASSTALTVGEDPATGQIVEIDADSLKQGLMTLGITIDEQGVLIVDKLQAKHIEVGSQETPNGITLYDDDTGNPYCIRMKAGQLITESGKCMTEIYNEPQAPASATPSPVVEPTPEPELEPIATTTEPVATSTEPVATTTETTATTTEPNNDQLSIINDQLEPETCDEPITYYLDADGDGYGDSGMSTSTCEQLAGYVLDNTDCDDSKVSVYPGAIEVCNGLDNNCSGQADEGCDCGQSICNASINLFGQCDNSCMGELGCGVCEPTCGCAEGFNDCDNDLSNGCETAGDCQEEESVIIDQ
ncbi:tail fiber domain-containing protein, partial [Patescibacteria group bacterium]|nr:tail fiber domain-containing protein [Patescibacteria group bacterium]